MNQRLTWEKPGQDDERFRRYLVLALLRSGVCVTLQDINSEYLFIANLFDLWEVNADAPPRDEDLFGPELAGRIAVRKQHAIETGEKTSLEAGVGADRYFDFIFEAIPARDGGPPDLMTTIIDLSEERQREKVLRTLLREVSHRSKNLLAIIQSIAAQTAKHTGTLEQFLLKFRGRLYSLSSSQDLITDSSWRGAFFFELVRDQTNRYLPENTDLISLGGEDLLLTPNASLHVGLALHELVVNAASHGALVSGDTHIAITCRKIVIDDGPGVEVTWNERVGEAEDDVIDDLPEIAPHFGSLVLERVVPGSVMGTSEYKVSGKSIFYRLKFPIDEST